MEPKLINLPLAYDPVSKQPSITLTVTYLANMLAIISLIILHIRDTPLTATTATIMYAIITTVLYLLRKLQHAKFDLKEKSIDLESTDDK